MLTTETEDIHWWDITHSFQGTEREAEELLDRIGEVLCGNPCCGEIDGETCHRDWFGSARLARFEDED